MYMRSIIAILDHNNNVNKKEVGEKIVFSKPSSRYVIKKKYELVQITNTIFGYL